MKSLLKKIYNIFLPIVLRLIGNKKKVSQAIFIYSFPRSGSTWVMNVVAKIKDSASLFEPFNPYACPFYAPYSDGHKLVKDKLTPKFFQLFKENLEAKKITRWQVGHTTLKKALKSRFFIVKMLRANFIIDKINAQFPENRKIYLLRHPITTIQSMLKAPGGWHKITTDRTIILTSFAFDDLYTNFIKNYHKKEHLLLIRWCVEAKMMLNACQNSLDKSYMVYYENLMANQDQEFQKLFHFLEYPYDESIKKSIKLPSKTTKKKTFQNNIITDWISGISDAEKAEYQKILDTFEITIYSAFKTTPMNIE